MLERLDRGQEGWREDDFLRRLTSQHLPHGHTAPKVKKKTLCLSCFMLSKDLSTQDLLT